MQTRFEIQTNHLIVPEDSVLSVQIGPRYFAYAIWDATVQELKRLQWFSLQDGLESVAQMFSTIPDLGAPYARKNVAFDYQTYSILPTGFNRGDYSPLLHLTGASDQDHILNETPTQDITLLYSIPYTVLNQLIQQVPGANYWHLQSVHINDLLRKDPQDLFYIHVVDGAFSLIAIKSGTLLLAQHYRYQAPADLLYYVLKTAQTNGLSQSALKVQVSGLVNQDSNLYRMLYDYFIDISLVPAEGSLPVDSGYPQHYFTSLKKIAQCAL